MDVEDATPIKQRFYQVSEEKKGHLEAEVKYMLHNKYISEFDLLKGQMPLTKWAREMAAFITLVGLRFGRVCSIFG